MLNEILEKRYSRRVFVWSILFFIVCLILMRYIVLPFLDDTIKTGWLLFSSNVLDGVLVSTLATVFIGVFFYALTPEVLKKSNITVVEPRYLPELFEKAFSSSEIWWYKGGCGRYLRTKTLPKMAEWARQTSLSREVRVVILDPLNDDLCEAHALFRRSTASAKVDRRRWDSEIVRQELYATIVTILIYQLKEPLLRINLSLASHYSAFRIDLSKEYVIITKEDRKAPAIKCDSETYFYQSYKDEVILSESQSKVVKHLEQRSYDLDNLSADDIKQVLRIVELENNLLTEESYIGIAALCKDRFNPYG